MPMRSRVFRLAVPVVCLVLSPAVVTGEIHRHPGSTTAIPHDKYVHVVSEADSPVQQMYVRTKDGVHVAAVVEVAEPQALASARRARSQRLTRSPRPSQANHQSAAWRQGSVAPPRAKLSGPP